jgi:phosphoglycerol geranylgeranyltransferase
MNSLDGAARGLGAIVDAVRVAGRTVLPVDPNPVPADWTHVTKVDPEPGRRLPLLYPLYLRHTDAVSVGGSSDVTAENTAETFALLDPVRARAFHEPSDPEHITAETRERAAFLAIPEVLNGDVGALIGDLGAGTERLRDDLVPALLAETLPDAVVARAGDALAEYVTSLLLRRAVFEAYVVNNPDSAAAERAGVGPEDVLDPAEARRHAMAADRHLGSEVVYLEYSGTDGGAVARDVLRALDGSLTRARIWYGGGIDAREPARAMLDAGADAVVVGNAFHAVADEEADRCRAAMAALPAGADREAIAEWLRDREPIEETAAAGFLASNPAVEAPAERAAEYLTATVEAVLDARALAAGGDSAGDPNAVPATDPNADPAAEPNAGLAAHPNADPAVNPDSDPDADAFAAWAAATTEGALPGEQAVAPALSGRVDARDYALALLAALLSVPGGTDLPVEHLAPVRAAGKRSTLLR